VRSRIGVASAKATLGSYFEVDRSPRRYTSFCLCGGGGLSLLPLVTHFNTYRQRLFISQPIGYTINTKKKSQSQMMSRFTREMFLHIDCGNLLYKLRKSQKLTDTVQNHK